MAPCMARSRWFSGATVRLASHRITGTATASSTINTISASVGLSNRRTSSAVAATATTKTTPNSAASFPSRLNLIRLSCAASGPHTKTLHAPVECLSGQPEALRGTADIAAGGAQSLLDRLARDRIGIACRQCRRLRTPRAHEVQIGRLYDVVARQELGAFDR